LGGQAIAETIFSFNRSSASGSRTMGSLALRHKPCLLYTSDAADDHRGVVVGGGGGVWGGGGGGGGGGGWIWGTVGIAF
jgi:hypothetical protein